MANVPTTSWSEAAPAGTDFIRDGDDAIRTLKTQVREVLAVDHTMSSSGQGADWGKHKFITLVEAADVGAGTTGYCALGAQTISSKPELCFTDEDNNDIYLTSTGSINTGALKSSVVADIDNLMTLIYPVGIVITLGVSTNPATLLGIGTWTAIAGKVIVGIDSGQTEFDVLDETGGSKTFDNSHTHGGATGGVSFGGGGSLTAGALDTAHTHSISSSGSATQSLLQPYIVKYVWQRTA
jgi:hypothetical protein